MTSSFSDLEKIRRNPLSHRKALYFIAFPVQLAVVLPRVEPAALGWNHRNHDQIEYKPSGFIALAGAAHQHSQSFRDRTGCSSSNRP